MTTHQPLADTTLEPDMVDLKPRNKRLFVSVVLNVLLGLAICALGLYAFMIRIDMEEQKGLLIRSADEQKKLNAYLTQARNDLEQARGESESLRAQLNAQSLQVQADEAKPVMPVTVGFRRSFWGRGIIARFHNTSLHTLTLILAVRNPTLSRSNRFQLVIDPDDTKEFGYSDGWEFASGDEVHVYHNDYRSLDVVVP